MSLVFLFFSPTVVLCFLTPESPTYAIASTGLPYYGSGFLFMALNICIVGYLQSIERSGAASLFTILRGIVFLVAAFALLPNLWGTVGLWLSVPCAEMLTTLAIVVYTLAVTRQPVGREKKNAPHEQ